MKILILTDSFNYCCGRSRHIVTLAKSLQDAGHYVFVVFGGGDGSGMLESLKIPYEVISEVLHSKRSYLNFIRGIIKIYKIQKEKNFDIMHAHDRYTSIIAKIATQFLNVPLIMSIHGSVKCKGILPAYTGNFFIAVSDETKKFAINEKPSIKHKIETIPNGIDLEYDSKFDRNIFKKSLGIDDDVIIISIIGRAIYQKGHKVLLNALDKLSTNSKLLCLIVGDGEYLNNIRNHADNLTIRTFIAGNVKDTSNYFLISDIIVLPSIYPEGLPITILEAGKYSKAVIASSIGGIKNLIIHKQNGYLVSPGNTEELLEALQILINSKDIREKLGGNLHKTIESSYTQKIMTDSILKTYEKIIKRERI